MKVSTQALKALDIIESLENGVRNIIYATIDFTEQIPPFMSLSELAGLTQCEINGLFRRAEALPWSLKRLDPTWSTDYLLSSLNCVFLAVLGTQNDCDEVDIIDLRQRCLATSQQLQFAAEKVCRLGAETQGDNVDATASKEAVAISQPEAAAMPEDATVPWDESDTAFITNSDFVALINSEMPAVRLTLQKLYVILKKNHAIRRMRRGKRTRVHLGDIRSHIKAQALSDDELQKTVDAEILEREKRKEAMEELKKLTGGKGISGYSQLTNLMNKNKH